MTKRYDREFKDYIAKLVVEENMVQAELAREHDIATSTIGRWVRNYCEEKEYQNETPKHVTPKEHEQMKIEYDKKVAELEEEVAILKKAMHVFMKDPR